MLSRAGHYEIQRLSQPCCARKRPKRRFLTGRFALAIHRDESLSLMPPFVAALEPRPLSRSHTSNARDAQICKRIGVRRRRRETAPIHARSLKSGQIPHFARCGRRHALVASAACDLLGGAFTV